MFLRTAELAFARFQARKDARALAIVFDRTAGELLSVARHLASTEASAEDLVQATFLQAIESADSHERGRPVLPWLLGILANKARRARRQARRPVDPRRLPTEQVADVASEVAANELGAELQAAIARLPEAYRPVLRLWFEHGLEAQEIASTLERPAGTVRAQLSRGLEQLRRALPKSLAGGAAVAAVAGRGLAAVRSAVLGAASGASTGLVPLLTFGGLFMLHHKLLAAGAALVLGLVGWSLLGGEAPPGPVLADGTRGGGIAATSAQLDVPAVAAGSPQRESSTPQPAAERNADDPEPAPDAATGELLVRLVAADTKEPMVGVGVALQRADDLQAFTRLSDFVPSDETGAVRFRRRPGTFHLNVDRVGSFAAADVVAGERTERTVEVPVGITVEGTVVDRGGRPVPGAAIVVHASRLSAPTVATADELGRFTASHLVSRVALQARAPGRTVSMAHPVIGGVGATLEMTLVVGDAGRRVFGIALDHQGFPLRRAPLAVLPEDSRDLSFWDFEKPQARPLWLRTDDDGRFSTDEAGIGRNLVVAQPTDPDIAACWTVADTTRGDAAVELRADPPAVLEGSLDIDVDAGGEEVIVQAWPAKKLDIGFVANLVASRFTRVAADGTFRLSGLQPGETEVVARRGFELVAKTVATMVPGQTVRWDPDVGQTRPLVVRVEAPSALPQRLVILVGPHVPDNSAPSIVPIVDGIARFDGRRAVDVDVTAVVMEGGTEMLQLARLSAVPVATDEVTLHLRAEDLPSRRIRGRLVGADGAPLKARTVTAMRLGDDGLVVLRSGVSGDDGTFAIGPLPAGSYTVRLGDLRSPRVIGSAVVAADRDEGLGDVRVEER